ncbi:MAG: sugar transferase, partial [Alphaproteobacteria bacterium]
MSATALNIRTWPAPPEPEGPESALRQPDPPVERLIAEEPAANANRRGPLRPERLVPSRARLAGQPLATAFRIIDLALILACTLSVLEWTSPLSLPETPIARLAPLALAAVALAWGLGAVKAYGFKARETFVQHAIRVATALALTAIVIAAIGILPIGLSDDWVPGGPWLGMTGLALAGSHTLAWLFIHRLRKAGRLSANIVIVGTGRNAERLIDGALESGEVSILGIFDDRAARGPRQIRGVPVLGDTEALMGHKILPFVDKVVIAVPSVAQGRVRQLVDKLGMLPNPVTLVIDTEDQVIGKAFARVSDTSLAYVSGKPNDNARAIIKRAQDLVVASIGLVFALPIMGLTALAVRLDSPGPVFFTQRRHGFNNEEIVVWKFRSMRADAADASASRQVERDDDRITRVGRFIRKTSLDELPQI